MNGTSITRGTIEKSYRFPWYMPWKVNDLHIGQDLKLPVEVTWDCEDSDFSIIFPATTCPFASPEIHSVNKHASAEVVPSVRGRLKGKIRYAIILTDDGKQDVVEGESSPPTMVIE